MDKNILRLKRLNKEQASLDREPLQNAFIKRKDDLKFYYCLYNLQDDFKNGFYFGLLELHPEYPFYAPKLFMYTPNGRYEQNLAICTSFTNYHQETWTSAWNVRSLIQATISFMYANEPSYGCRADASEIKKKYARESLSWNLENSLFKQVFGQTIKSKLPDIVKAGIHIYDKQMIAQLKKLGLESANIQNLGQGVRIGSSFQNPPAKIQIKQRKPIIQLDAPLIRDQPVRIQPELREIVDQPRILVDIEHNDDILHENMRLLREEKLRIKREKRKKIIKYIGIVVFVGVIGIFAYYSLTKPAASQTKTQTINPNQTYGGVSRILTSFTSFISNFKSSQNQKIIVTDK